MSNVWFSAQWQNFSAGIALILLSIFLFSVNGILGLFKIKAKIPSLIPWSVFILGVGIVLYSFNFWKGIYALLMEYSAYNNLAETIVGMVFILMSLYLHTTTVSKKAKSALFVIGILFILDGTRVFPLISSAYSALNRFSEYVGYYSIHNPVYVVVVVVCIAVMCVVALKLLDRFMARKKGVSNNG